MARLRVGVRVSVCVSKSGYDPIYQVYLDKNWVCLLAIACSLAIALALVACGSLALAILLFSLVNKIGRYRMCYVTVDRRNNLQE